MTREALLDTLRHQGVPGRIISAFAAVRREDFVSDSEKRFAYSDNPLPIGFGQTISQPSTIAFMLAKLEVDAGQKILEVGSGSGYVLALLSEISPGLEIYGTEIIGPLARSAADRLRQYDNIHVFHTSGRLGLPKKGPFDRILVSAAAETFPEELLDQLKTPGIFLGPVKNSIIKKIKQKNRVITEVYPGFSFVPLILT